ncbi:cytoplasmic tRNA 2-thiolation protein 2 [Aspergillus nanangensis]|uniref:Cytoplasmic tRNA 2-thiolation protein 2 n=1 Tax=Aspergillus nanangensis TaxID=2582783 RepID=A0AAD4CNQ4_ASPNN|nr:cytoplasmic tRNA 2-thiolation protein 2 [Aspergillus nanangensis]
MPAKDLSDPCMTCKEAESSVFVRKRHLCNDCYVQFVSHRVFKRMEKYRLLRGLPKTSPCKLLLPLSYGLSSSVLLRLLHHQIEDLRSKPHAPAGFTLDVIIIEPSTISPSSPPDNERFELFQKQFPLCTFTRVPFESIFDFVPDIHEVLSAYVGSNFTDDSSLSNKERLNAFRSSITTATSKADVDTTLMNRLIVAFAKKLDCLGVVWGDSDNRLAAKTLASAAKGRGASVTWQVADGMSPWGLEFIFPLRDLFQWELQSYANLMPELNHLIVADEKPSETTLTKNLSIDELMMRYVTNQGEKYPGIMSNVTRTANKLQSAEDRVGVPRYSATHANGLVPAPECLIFDVCQTMRT